MCGAVQNGHSRAIPTPTDGRGASDVTLESAAGGAAFLVGRVVFGGLLAFMGFNHFGSVDGMAGYAEAKGVPAPRAMVFLSGVVLLVGGVSIALGAYPAVGAALVVGFFVVVTPVMHDFWTVEDPEQRQSEMNDFLKNAVMAAGSLVILALAGTAWPYALNVGL